MALSEIFKYALMRVEELVAKFPAARHDLRRPFGKYLSCTFGRKAPVILEIGFGMGETTATIAENRPELDFIGVEVHTPGVGSLLKLIGEKQLKKMKKTAFLINTARGPVVDSQALADALKSGEIAGAAVDVFEMEPPVPQDHVLFGAPNLLATPHVAFASQQAFEKRAVIVGDNIVGWLNGNMPNVVC